ncbi:MAG: AzlC family ABC transporter permease [Pleurocapsa sp. SU_196_0]|nr:AzlC family ABC transporter permease [Pleurocapsa sp. SU_196_0]
MLGNIPFGLVAGIAGVKAGLSLLEVTLMSSFVYAGAAQLVALQMMGSGTAMPLVLLASLVVNLRYVMYSSALAKPLEAFSGWRKALAGFLMVDQNFAMTMARYAQLGPRLSPWYYLGAGTPIWLNWVVFTIVGALLGASIPESWNLEFAVPLCFLVLLVPTLKDRPSWAAAVVGGLVATVLAGLPYRFGLFVGAMLGIGAGVWLENRAARVGGVSE